MAAEAARSPVIEGNQTSTALVHCNHSGLSLGPSLTPNQAPNRQQQTRGLDNSNQNIPPLQPRQSPSATSLASIPQDEDFRITTSLRNSIVCAIGGSSTSLGVSTGPMPEMTTISGARGNECGSGSLVSSRRRFNSNILLSEAEVEAVEVSA
ncbi:unnamed protein product [Protopolystoma xenopodis]|uniref:Uncharacterized protein n=1 Tax=Protopolystoma xenopodis TaxID=117903 RepID=A0A448WGI7_9PLAT|nr:unnamed protein product [Protopolystoma xenopodis]